MIPALTTDQYTLTMAQSFFRHNQNERCSFEMFVRSLPRHRAFLVACGLDTVIDFLENFRFAEDELDFLAENELYDAEFIEYLREVRFTGNLTALPEGTVIAPQTPILRVDANRIEACLIESAVLTIINHQTMIASKAVRINMAANGKPVWDFSLRRLHGVGSAVETARAAYLGGCSGTATMTAGKALGIPTTGTMAHHFIQSFGRDHEQEAFEQFLCDYPQNNTLLIDTYDSFNGIHVAIAASRAVGIPIKAVRLDSGSLADIAEYCRKALDKAGMPETQIVASNDLDEYKILALETADAPIDAYGVGTMLGTSADAPSIGGVYKITAQEVDDGTRPQMVMKQSIGKKTDPGRHQVFRSALFPMKADVLAMVDEEFENRTPMLKLVMEDGARCAPLTDLGTVRTELQATIAEFPLFYRHIENFNTLSLTRSDKLETLRHELSAERGEVHYRAEVI